VSSYHQNMEVFNTWNTTSNAMPVFPPSTKSVLPSPFLAVVALSWTHQHHRKTALKLNRHAVVLRPAQYSWRNLSGRVLPETNTEPCVQKGPTPVNSRMTSDCLTYIFSSIFLCQYAFILNHLKHRGYDTCMLHTYSFCSVLHNPVSIQCQW